MDFRACFLCLPEAECRGQAAVGDGSAAHDIPVGEHARDVPVQYEQER